MSLLWDCLTESQKESIKAVMPKKWTPPLLDKADTFNLKPETAEELAREMQRRPHHPKGEGYR